MESAGFRENWKQVEHLSFSYYIYMYKHSSIKDIFVYLEAFSAGSFSVE